MFGRTPPLIEEFSWAGGIPIFFDIAGNRLATPENRQQPAITAPDGADTTFFGGSDPDGTGFPNFFGTLRLGPSRRRYRGLDNGAEPVIRPR